MKNPLTGLRDALPSAHPSSVAAVFWVLGFAIGACFAAGLALLFLGWLWSGFLVLAAAVLLDRISAWLMPDEEDEEFDRSACPVCGGCRWIENMQESVVVCPYCETPEALRLTIESQKASSPAPDLSRALHGGPEPSGSAGAGETRCGACGGTGGFVDPLTNDAFLCPVCRPLKISPAPGVGGAGGRIPAEPTGDPGAGDLHSRQLLEGKHEGDTCNRIDGTNGLCKGVLRCQEPVNCSCHINPPCGACTDAKLECPDCGWEEGE
jgi:hypothetical protein